VSELHIPRVAILASGSGTTAEAYARAIHAGQVSAEIDLVVADKTSAGILERARLWNIRYGWDVETTVISSETHPGGQMGFGQTLEESEAIATLLHERGIRLAVLLGYMKIIHGTLMEEFGYDRQRHSSMYQARMVNTHPGPLPETAKTMGKGAAAKVLELGMPYSEHTVHVVEPDVDAGPTVAAHRVPIKPGDTPETLNERTQLIEKATIAYAVDKFLRDQDAYEASQGR